MPIISQADATTEVGYPGLMEVGEEAPAQMQGQVGLTTWLGAWAAWRT